MSSALLDAPTALFGSARRAGGGRPTLEELLDTTWRAARADGEADCPICHEAMHAEGDLARCDACGTTLA
jgi:hypothetical protein